jgi:thiopurine S-methyltransferase
MEADFWHRRWRKNEIGFHEEDGNHLLKTYIEKLGLPAGARIFVPLCGKTRDIAWLLSQGFSVVGIELNKLAVEQLFTELDVQVEQGTVDGFEHHRTDFTDGQSLDIFTGNFFAFNESLMGKIDAVFDRAALVALPEEMRNQYTQHLLAMSNKCEQLLVCYEYAEGLMQGPPHSVNCEEVMRHYGKEMSVQHIYREKVEGGFREQSEVYEAVYLITAK